MQFYSHLSDGERPVGHFPARSSRSAAIAGRFRSGKNHDHRQLQRTPPSGRYFAA